MELIFRTLKLINFPNSQITRLRVRKHFFGLRDKANETKAKNALQGEFTDSVTSASLALRCIVEPDSKEDVS